MTGIVKFGTMLKQMNDPTLSLLWELLAIDSPSGDEGTMADWLVDFLERAKQGITWERWGDSVIAVKGTPKIALFAHQDTTGFTLGYDKALIPIGGPAAQPSDPLRPIGQVYAGNKFGAGGKLTRSTTALPGSRWVYATVPVQEGDEIVAPYIDNRGGLWAAMQALLRCEHIAVAFTTGEEHSGKGAIVCARRLFEQWKITQALISDITWDTKHVHCGQGVAISLRDRSVPRQRFLEKVLALAERSQIPFQREIESSGGSDGSMIDRGGVPIDWVFVGAPEVGPHRSAERINVNDLKGMADMLTYLVDSLTQ